MKNLIGMRHIIPISGKDSLATAIVQMAREPELSYEFIYNDTRAELPETYAWMNLVERTLGITIHRAGKSLEDIIYKHGILPSGQVRYCTREAKIYPMHDFIGKDQATIYIGLRADEDRKGAKEEKNIAVKYPLRELGINLALVYKIVGERNLMPPTFFWQRLHDAVRKQIGSNAFTIDELPKWMFDRIFAWRSRPNCYFCFYQRLYEWVGLLDTHPDLFARAEMIESTIGADKQESAFHWNSGYSLREIRDKASSIFQNRVDAICKMLTALTQLSLFEDRFDDMDKAQTSCGLIAVNSYENRPDNQSARG